MGRPFYLLAAVLVDQFIEAEASPTEHALSRGRGFSLDAFEGGRYWLRNRFNKL
jgi:hypothetical protein